MDQLEKDREKLIQLLRKAEEIEEYIEHLRQKAAEIFSEQNKYSDVLEEIYIDIDMYRYKTNDHS